MDRNFFSGIDFTTGDYSGRPISFEELTRWARTQRRDRKEERELRWAKERNFRNRGPDRRPAPDVDPLNLASSGWGVIFPQGTPHEVKDALRPLLTLRREQATRKKETYYQELEYAPGESKDSFFRNYKIEAGPADPEKLPYYLLIVGGPEVVPYRFQYQIDMQYAVGRIAFDRAEDYGRYAASVVAAESGHCHVLPEAGFFSVRAPGDRPTEIMTENLIEPLVKKMRDDRSEWKIRSWIGEDATKDQLLRLIGCGETPALLVTAAHGLGFPSDHPRQREQQGAIVCQNWDRRGKAVRSNHFLTAADIGDDARVHGLIAFLFGCNTAGSTHVDNFPPGRWGQPKAPPQEPFISGLARRLLSHPNGSALAVVGHVDRTWTSAFGRRGGEATAHVESFFKQLFDGFPIGVAMDWINELFAEISTELTDALDRFPDHEYTKTDTEPAWPEHEKMARLWRANNDARNLIVLGDPAVRLANGPQIARSEPVLELRAEPRGLQSSLRSHWETHIKKWFKEISERKQMDLDIDPATVVRSLRDREEDSR